MNDKRQVLSVSGPRKNISMVVYHNLNEQGKKQSITRFEKTNPARGCHNRFNPAGGLK